MPAFLHTKVDSNRLSITANNIDNSIKMAEKALAAVEESMQSTLRPSWSGEASSKFFSQYTGDVQRFNALIAELRLLNGKLMQAAGVYNKADDNAGDIVRSLNIG